jgi:protein required for attachment to host cells
MSQKWVVVADQSRARIFAMDSPSAPLREIEDLLHPAGRQRAQELKSDRPPRLFRGKGEASHPVDTKVDVKEQEAINFARRIADRIERARTQAELTQLVVIAPPDFLGVLRAALSPSAMKHLVQTIDKNLVRDRGGDPRVSVARAHRLKFRPHPSR